MNDDRREAGLLNGGEPQWVKVRPEWVERELARRSCLDMLMSRFELDAALVSVPQLGKVLGMSKSTIYACVKAGTFFIPHRLIGTSPVFTIDDVVTWYLSGHAAPDPEPASTRSLSMTATSRRKVDSAGASRDAEMELLDKRRRDREVDDMVRRAMKSVGGSSDGRKAG